MLKKMMLSCCLMAGIGLGGCATTNNPVTERNLTQLQNTNWILKEIQGVELSTSIPMNLPTIQFSNESVSGSDGCNRFTGGYAVKAQQVRFSNLVSTRMACLSATDLPQQFNTALANVTQYEADRKELKLLDAQKRTLLKFVPAQRQ